MPLEWTPDRPLEGDLDASDWTFRSTFLSDGGRKVLRLGGIATVADVSVNGEHVLHSESMFRSYDVEIDARDGANEVVVHVHALAPLLAQKRPRPRWRTKLVEQQQLRWYRTSFYGRMPTWHPKQPIVGPWKPCEVLDPADARRVSLRVRMDGDDGVVECGEPGVLRVGGHEGERVVRIPNVERWWPHTHGDAVLHEVTLDGDPVGRVGFRTIDAETDDGDFRLRVNGIPVFARGGCWSPGSLELLEQVRDAGMNMVRIPG